MSIDTKYIVTGGKTYTDIDVLACVSAYKQFLELLGKQTLGIVSPIYNQTISNQIKKWPIDVQKGGRPLGSNNRFIIMDVSDENHFFDFVKNDEIEAIFDHHFGYMDYWKERLGTNSRIEKVGACATLVWEKFNEHQLQNLITCLNANLLYTAIFANTLDFKSFMTSERDIRAKTELEAKINLPSDWKKDYYKEINQAIHENILGSISQDTKIISSKIGNIQFGQLECWNAAEIFCKFIINKHSVYTTNILDGKIDNYLVNIVSIEENASYLFTNNSDLHSFLIKFTNGCLFYKGIKTPRIWQRKEVLKELQLAKLMI